MSFNRPGIASNLSLDLELKSQAVAAALAAQTNAAAPPAAFASGGSAGAGGGKKGGTIRVLSVDDDPVNQMVIQNMLAPEGYEVLFQIIDVA